MKKLLLRLAGLTAFAIFLNPVFLLGQGLTSGAMDGIVTNSRGEPVANATVTVVHTPTGTTLRAVTRPSGYYGVTGLRVGGPFTVTVSSDLYQATSVKDVYVELSRSQSVNIQMADRPDIQELEAFVITGEEISNVFNANKTGAGSVVDGAAVANSPASRQSFNDFARFNPYISINEGDRNELTVAGQNSRFNNLQIDGVRTNDQFGLESAGVASLNNPVSIETIEQINVEVAPYDVRQSGFTGASVNAVTKSGTNAFHGTFYTYYTDDKMRGDSVINGSNPLFREWTWGANVGGPILKDRLFFFVDYSEFAETAVAGSPGFTPDPAALQQVITYAQNTLGFDPGTWSGPDRIEETDEKIFARIDWNITNDHRFTARYRNTKGVNPVLDDFDDNGQTSLSTNFYDRDVNEEDYVFELFSTWTPDFQTEFRVVTNQYESVRNTANKSPQIVIDDFPTVGIAGASGNELFLGTGRFSHGNELNWDTLQLSGVATWFKDDFEITFGADFEETKFENLFLESSLGNWGFDNLPNFLADVPGRNESNQTPFRVTGIDGQNPVAEPEVAVLGAFIQNKWTVNSRLTLIGGVRADFVMQDTQAPEAQGFEQAFGFKNNGSVDGTTTVAPRFSFNYALDEDRTKQIRGGIGLFLGRSPGVWISNAFTNNGETTGRVNLSGGLVDYMTGNGTGPNFFDPANPIVSVPRQASTPVVDALEEDLKLPTSWRWNVAFDWQLPQDWVFTAEVLVTDVEEALWVQNVNQNRNTEGPDGRPWYNGRVSSLYSDVFVLRNTQKGFSDYYTLSLTKAAQQGGWNGSLAYTFGRSTDANPFTSSRAVSNWNSRSVFDVNGPEETTSLYEVRNRFLATFGYNFDWGQGHRTLTSLVWESRDGRPYSYTFRSDMNGDGVSNNDLLYVPTGPNDPNVNFGPSFPTDTFFQFLEDEGLNSYAGTYVPRNDHHNPWVHTVDVKITQVIPIWERVTTEIFADLRNIGNLIDDDWGVTKEVGFPFNLRTVSGSRDTANTKYNFNGFTPDSISPQVGQVRSRWSIQLGARVRF